MNEFKRSGLVVLRVLVVVAVVTASVVALANPQCVEHMIAEVTRGMACGLLVSGVEVLGKVSRPTMACRPVWRWWCYGTAVAWREFKFGVVGGFLLGLLLALWSCWRG